MIKASRIGRIPYFFGKLPEDFSGWRDHVCLVMKRSEINAAIWQAKAAFANAGWFLPPSPRWDVTDVGLGRFREVGLVLVNLAEEPEYCEKLMFSLENQVTPMHTHRVKKEDIICRAGRLALELWAGDPRQIVRGEEFAIHRNGAEFAARNGEVFVLEAGERVTLLPAIYHSFWAASAGGCVIGEVSTANDDANDNFFVDPAIGRFPIIVEDEPPIVRLISEP
jgi:D-lyxose ketol-isomerase